MLDGTKNSEELLSEAQKLSKRPHSTEAIALTKEVKRVMPVGYRYPDGKVQAPVGTNLSTLNVPPGTRLYYGPGDMRNGEVVRPNRFGDD